MDSDKPVKAKKTVKSEKPEKPEKTENAEIAEKPKNKGGRPAYRKDDDPIAMVGGVKLTEKQKRFIANYNGNGVEAAKKAGYSPKYARNMATYLMTKCTPVKEALRAKSEMVFNSAIADSQELLVRWTRALRCLDGSPDDTGWMSKEQLRASENIAKTMGLFVEMQKVEHKTYVMPCGGQVGEAVMQGSLDIVEKLKKSSEAGAGVSVAVAEEDSDGVV